MSTWKNRYAWLSAACALMLLMLALLLVWWASSEVASPSRRPIQDYHREFLGKPDLHGVRLREFALHEGTPCLLVEPLPTLAAASRGQRVRDQLNAKGVPLPATGQIIGNLVLVHGRKGRKEDYLLIAERFCAGGFRCLIPDMPGHGDHPGKVARYGVAEGTIPAMVIAEAARQFGFDVEPAGLMGISMGGSVAVHAAAKDPHLWKALIVVSSFDALHPVILQQASSLAGDWLGGLWTESAAHLYQSRTGVALSEVQPVVHAATLRMPTLIAHGTDDHVVPLEAGRRLFAALPDSLKKQWIEIPGADHDDVLITDYPIYAAMVEWMLRNVTPAQKPDLR